MLEGNKATAFHALILRDPGHFPPFECLRAPVDPPPGNLRDFIQMALGECKRSDHFLLRFRKGIRERKRKKEEPITHNVSAELL